MSDILCQVLLVTCLVSGVVRHVSGVKYYFFSFLTKGGSYECKGLSSIGIPCLVCSISKNKFKTEWKCSCYMKTSARTLTNKQTIFFRRSLFLVIGIWVSSVHHACYSSQSNIGGRECFDWKLVICALLLGDKSFFN